MAKKSAKAAAADAAGATPAPATGTGAKTKTQAKPEVKVNTELAAIVRQYDQAAEKTGLLMVDMCEFITAQNLSNPVIIKTLMDVRGVTESTAKTQCSRMRALIKDTDQFEALKRGDITVRAAVKSAQTRRAASSVSKQKAFDNKLNQFCQAAKAIGQDKKTILVTVEAKLEEAGIK